MALDWEDAPSAKEQLLMPVEMEEGELVAKDEEVEGAHSDVGQVDQTRIRDQEPDGTEIAMTNEAAQSYRGQVQETSIHEQEPDGTEIAIITEVEIGPGVVDMGNTDVGSGTRIDMTHNADLSMENTKVGNGREIARTSDADRGPDGGERENAQVGTGRGIAMVSDTDLGPDGGESEKTEVVNGTEIAMTCDADLVSDGGGRENGEAESVPVASGGSQLQEGLKEDRVSEEVCQRDEAEAGRVVLSEGSLSALALEGRGYVLVAEGDSDSEDEDGDDEKAEVQIVGNMHGILGDSSSDETSGSSSDEEEPVQVAVKHDSKSEGRKKSKDSSDDDVVEPPRTKNELAALPPIPKIDVVLQPFHLLQPFGSISSILGKHLIVQSSGSISTVAHVLNEGSILWLTKNRVPLGIIDEVFGPVKTPFYLVRYNNETEIPEGAVESAEVSVVPEFISYIVDKDPELYKKGYDASGCNDEELSDAEVEFSDDEQEAAYKKAAARKSKPLQGRDEMEPGNGVCDVPAFPSQQRDRSSRAGRGRGQQRGRSRFGDEHKMSRGGGSNDLADMAVQRIADMDIQLPSTSQRSLYNDRSRHSEGGSQKGNHSRPPMGWRKLRPRSDGSESEAMSTRTDASAGSASDEAFGNRSPFPERVMQQEQVSGLALLSPGWGPANSQGYRPPYQGGPNQGYRMQFSPQSRPPQGTSPIPQGGWAPPGLVNGQPIPGLYQHPGYANFIHQQHGPPLAVGPTGFAPHPAYGIPLGDPGFNMAMNTGPLPGHPGSGGFYPANVPFSHLPHMLPQQALNYVNPLGFVQHHPGHLGQAGYSLNSPYSQGTLVYMDNGMRQPPPNSPGGFNPQLSQPAGIMFQQTPSPNPAFHSARSPMNGSFARRK